QFVDVSRGYIWEQTFLLGLTFVGLGICTDSIYALLAGMVGNWLKRRGNLQKGQRYISGGIYLALGLVSAFSGSRKH
ncbi:MAG: LysE family translocator, partial [Firmicutes bacterium]|nr:LysE family translocator [Bacillota bacterium]